MKFVNQKLFQPSKDTKPPIYFFRVFGLYFNRVNFILQTSKTMLESNLQVQTKNILNSNHFHSIRRLGKGGFGHVLLATKATSSSTFYAVKCISKKKMIKDPLLKKFLFQQINTMASLDHPNIVKLHKTFEEGDWYFLVMQYCDIGNLYNFQSKLTNKVFTRQQSINIFNQILRGVEFIHKNNIIHRDLKLENVFLKKDPKNGTYICKIGDFGLARELEGGTAITNCGTQTYMAPEILSCMKYDKQADIWSLGVLFYYLFCGDFPFKGINILNDIQIKCSQGFNFMENVQKNKPQIIFKSKKQEVLWSDLFYKIFTLDPKNRITLQQLKYHPILKKKDDSSSGSNTISEEVTTNDDENDEIGIEWQIKRINYLQHIMKTIKQQNFLSQFLLSGYNFYMNKVLLYFLNTQPVKNFRKDEESNSKLLEALKNLEKQVFTNLKNEHQKIRNLKTNGTLTAKQAIEKFDEGFNLKIEDFHSFKMGYRNTIGKVYEEVHRKFLDNSYERAVLKLKVFVCHIVNRVFSGSIVNQNLWPCFFSWLKKNKLQYSTKFYDFVLLEEWMKNEKVQNLQKSQEIINQMFYK